MAGPAFCEPLAFPFDRVLEAKPRAAQVAAPHTDHKRIVEPRGLEPANARLDGQGLDALPPQSRVAAVEAGQVVDAPTLEPDEVGGVMRDALGVRLGEADAHVRGEIEGVHGRTVEGRLAQLIREAQPCVVLTGAGVSTESGIPDFRSPSGLWAQFDPHEYGSLDAFRADPEKVWRFYAPRFSMLSEAEPNAAHVAIAELERRGLVEAVITQNIDLLHERAGSRDVIEVHGSIRTSSCPGCGSVHELAVVLAHIEAGGGAPRCPACGGVLKPDVVFFGELLPRAAIDRAYELAAGARLMLVAGSALEVHPVAGLPLETLRAGGRLAIVNRGPTALDGRATVRAEGSAGEVLTAVAEELTVSS